MVAEPVESKQETSCPLRVRDTKFSRAAIFQPMPIKGFALLAAVLIACLAAEVSRARRCAHFFVKCARLPAPRVAVLCVRCYRLCVASTREAHRPCQQQRAAWGWVTIVYIYR